VTAVQFNVLGPLEAIRDDVPVPLGGPRPRAVLAALLIADGRHVRVDALIDAVWGATPPDTAIKTIQKYISYLRAQLDAPGLITSRADGYELSAPNVDRRRFEELLDRAGGALMPDHSVALLTEALDLWRGEPYGDLPELAAAEAERRRLAERRLSASESLAEARLALGQDDALIGWLEELVWANPLRERLWAVLMQALYRSGRQAEALAAYQRLRTTLVDELGVEPTPEVRALHERILKQDTDPADDLPLHLTSFVGRDAELAELTGLLTGHRLVTLTGPAGSGKTRLAVELLASTREGSFVELAGVIDGDRVTATVAGVLRLKEQPGRRLDDLLIDSLAGRRLLLVLDNCEHLLDATAALIARLLRGAPQVKVLATSRQPLGVAGEVVLDVPPLAVPATDELAEVAASDAGRLLAERARAVDGRFALTATNAAAVARIARRLDGMPLALELAAARLRVFDAHQLAELLDDRFRVLVSTLRTAPARHQTLRAAVAWSYDLLTPEEQALFRVLSVFEGGFTLEAAERVGDAIALLPSLVERSLVVVDRRSVHRYRLLETLREYGRAQLDPAEAEQAHRAVLQHFLELAARAADGIRGPRREEWLAQLDAERDNLQAVFRWALTHGERAAGLRLTASLVLYWDEQALFREGAEKLSDALAGSDDVDPDLRAEALAGAALMAIGEGEHQQVTELSRRSLALATDEYGRLRATTLLGHANLYQGNYSEANRLLEASLDGYHRLGRARDEAEVLGRLGHLHRLRGDYAAARERLEQSLALHLRIGDGAGRARMVWQLGVLARYQGDYAGARTCYAESLALFEDMADPSGAAHVQYSMADVARLAGEPDLAAELYRVSLDTLRESGDLRCVASILFNLGALALDESDPTSAVERFAESLTLRRHLRDRAGIAECIEALAAMDERAAVAVQLLGAAQALRTSTGAARPESDERAHATRVAALRSAIGDDAFENAWSAGTRMDSETAVDTLLPTICRPIGTAT
jgi:predicted ATPase/DNA-binding SARP family transcriptional activator